MYSSVLRAEHGQDASATAMPPARSRGNALSRIIVKQDGPVALMTEIPSQPTSPDRQYWSPNVGPAWHFRFFAWLLRWGGMTRAYHISYITTFWYVLFYPSIRSRCRHYLNRRFPQRRGRVRQFLDSYRLVRSFGETLVDIVALDVLGKDALFSLSPDRERLCAMADGQKGIILLLAHMGCWQAGMSSTGDLPQKTWHVLIPEPRTLAMLEPDKAGVIDPRSGLDGVMQMTAALLRGEIVAMMGDRTFGDERNRIEAGFLGGTIKLPVTPYRLASACGTPIAVMLAAKIAPRTYQMRLVKIIDVPPALGRKSGALRALRAAVCEIASKNSSRNIPGSSSIFSTCGRIHHGVTEARRRRSNINRRRARQTSKFKAARDHILEIARRTSEAPPCLRALW